MHRTQNKEYNYLIIIVALVAIVAIVVMIYNTHVPSSCSTTEEDLAGMASKKQKDMQKDLSKELEMACMALSIQINIFNCKDKPMKGFEQVCKELLKQKKLLGCK